MTGTTVRKNQEPEAITVVSSSK